MCTASTLRAFGGACFGGRSFVRQPFSRNNLWEQEQQTGSRTRLAVPTDRQDAEREPTKSLRLPSNATNTVSLYL